MPSWTRVDLPYRPHAGESDTFARSRTAFPAGSLGKSSQAADSGRQAHFERQVREIADHLGAATVPVFVDFAGERRRMDKGCVGHSVARGFLRVAGVDAAGSLTAVEIVGR